MSKLKIRKWDPQTIKPASTTLLVGRRGTGKSTILRDLAWQFAQRQCIDLVVGMSPTEESSESLGSFIPRTLIYNEYREDVLQKLMDSQRRAWRRGHGPNVLLFLDDCGFDKSVFKSKIVRELFLNGRHRRIGLVFALQYCLDIPPDIRSNIDIVIAARDPIHSSREKLWKNFFGVFRDYQEFSLTFDTCTNNFETLVMHNNQGCPTNNIEDTVYWYKADPNRGQFRLGADVYWKMDERYYRDREDELEEEQRAKEELERRQELQRTTIANVAKADVAGRTVVPRYR